MKRSVLLIDDDFDFRNALKQILTKAGYDCSEAESARAGLHSVEVKKPDIILLDVMMEDISSGFRFLKERQIAENQNGAVHVPILIVTSIQKLTSLNFKDRIQGLLHKNDGFISKPVFRRI